MGDNMITVPYDDFVNGICAMADLDNIKALITSGGAYCSDSIKAILGIEVKKYDATNTDGKSDGD